MIFQSSMGSKKQGVIIPTSITQGNFYPDHPINTMWLVKKFREKN
jgi:hypothetical protein